MEAKKPGSNQQVCLTAQQPGGLSDVLLDVVPSQHCLNKISSKGLTAIYTKICTYHNFLLYGPFFSMWVKFSHFIHGSNSYISSYQSFTRHILSSAVGQNGLM